MESKSVLKRKRIQRGERPWAGPADIRCNDCGKYHSGPGLTCRYCLDEQRAERLANRR